MEQLLVAQYPLHGGFPTDALPAVMAPPWSPADKFPERIHHACVASFAETIPS